MKLALFEDSLFVIQNINNEIDYYEIDKDSDLYLKEIRGRTPVMYLSQGDTGNDSKMEANTFFYIDSSFNEDNHTRYKGNKPEWVYEIYYSKDIIHIHGEYFGVVLIFEGFDMSLIKTKNFPNCSAMDIENIITDVFEVEHISELSGEENKKLTNFIKQLF